MDKVLRTHARRVILEMGNLANGKVVRTFTVANNEFVDRGKEKAESLCKGEIQRR